MNKCYKCEDYFKCHFLTLPIGEKFDCKHKEIINPKGDKSNGWINNTRGKNTIKTIS
ncbi:unnamed protein product [marine sediment metagenome]|uniref:Uncharacterized protein n=1 Tax=marine sediment metagenome TaxID=412755 RepID=X1FVI4_9ZZZZ